MTTTDIIVMARKAGLDDEVLVPWAFEIERFAALVAAAEREARIEAQKLIEALQAENISNEANRLAAVLNEREACAKVCEPTSPRPCDCDFCDCGNSGDKAATADWDASSALANAIRARGETK